ncbi:MAG: hypothetical protein U5L45_15595 [Saprospiraceae bacterium]|nr:hypothetical protein [Saprospiraceae bacterium]
MRELFKTRRFRRAKNKKSGSFFGQSPKNEPHPSYARVKRARD